MQSRNAFPLLILCALSLGACGDDGAPEENIPAELAATWTAEPACLPQCGFTLTSTANPADSLNATSFTGLTTEITIGRSGSFTLVSRPSALPPSTGRARLIAQGTMVVTDQAGVTDTIDYTLEGGSYLSLRFRRIWTVVDFNGDGRADPAYASGRFRRR